jgi:hypothetical protein
MPGNIKGPLRESHTCNQAKNAHRSKTVKVLSGAYTNGLSDVSIKARFQKGRIAITRRERINVDS